jgi:hypothetical protein
MTPRRPTTVERYFRPAIELSQGILTKAGLPDVDAWGWLHPDGTWTPFVPGSAWIDHLNAPRPGESIVGGSHAARARHGEGSEEDYAARIVWDYRRLVANIEPGNSDDAMYLAARLGDLVAERDMAPASGRWVKTLRDLTAGNLERQQRAAILKKTILARGLEIRDALIARGLPWSKNSIAKMIAKERGEPERVRSFRRFLQTL